MHEQQSELCTESVTPTEASALLTSMSERQSAMLPSPDPPYSSGTRRPMSPSSPAFFTASTGNCSFRSRSAAPGAQTSRA